MTDFKDLDRLGTKGARRFEDRLLKNISLEKLLEVGIALSSEKDEDILLETILNAAMDITNCDGGTIYTLGNEELKFRFMITRSMNFIKGGVYGKIELPPVPMTLSNVCSCSALERSLINVPNVYKSDKYDFSGPRKYDSITGYNTVSMMVIPMEDNYGDIIGVLQLINAKDFNGETIEFEEKFEKVISSLASQAAISLTNKKLTLEVEELLNSLVRVLSTAIDERSSYNANHTKNMARYGERFIDWVNADESTSWLMNAEEKKEFLMSVWLHDVGKLVVPLEIMDKQNRLGSKIKDVIHRFEIIELNNKIKYLEDNDILAFEARKELNKKALEHIKSMDTAFFVSDEMLEELHRISVYRYIDAEGVEKPYLEEDEMKILSVRKGTLTDEERNLMENHVVMTDKMLREVKFSRNYKKVADYAASHHEYLNGRGYPKGLKANEIPKEVRLITILDIFDALTASDRPYKKALTIEKAFEILESMAKDGQLDGEIVAMLKKSEAWLDEKTEI